MSDKSLGTYINPFTDFGFKKLFGSEESKPLLISFLNDLLPIENKIVSLEFKNIEKLGMLEEDRHAYELSLKYYRDFINVLNTTKKDAKLEEKQEIAMKMLQENLNIELVMKVTGLSKQTLTKLSKNLPI